MSKSFRDWNVDQVWLLPPSINDFVPADHVAHFVRDTVRTALDLGLIYRSYRSERGQAPFHPAMMVALLLYAYSQSRKFRDGLRGCPEKGAPKRRDRVSVLKAIGGSGSVSAK